MSITTTTHEHTKNTNKVTYHGGDGVLVKDHGEEGLDTGLCGSRDGVGQGGGVLDLQEHGSVDQESCNSRQGHQDPESQIAQEIHLPVDLAQLAREQQNGGQENNRDGSVVVKEAPLVVIDHGQRLLDIDSIEGHKDTGSDTGPETCPGEIALAIRANKEAEDDDSTGQHGCGRGLLAEHGPGEEDVEEDGERAGDLVEGDLDQLEAEVVEGQHQHIDDRERGDLAGDVQVKLERRDHRERAIPNCLMKKYLRVRTLSFLYHSSGQFFVLGFFVLHFIGRVALVSFFASSERPFHTSCRAARRRPREPEPRSIGRG